MRMGFHKANMHFTGCLVGAACGDAMGLPWENQTHERILEITEGAGVTGIVPIPRTHPVWLAGEQPLGSTSDDWALTGATARALSLIGWQRKPSHRAAMIIARERQMAYLQTGGAGWGQGTVKGVKEIGRFLDGYMDGRRPWVEVEMVDSTEIGKGAGCGPAMQISPLGLMDGLSGGTEKLDLRAWCRLMAFMTHGNIEATIASHAMALATSYALLMATRDLNDYKPATALRSIIEILSETYGSRHRVINALCLMATPGFLDDRERLRVEIGNAFVCWESVPFAIGTWMRHHNDVRGAILEAATAGGDADSTASMAGALAGAYAGINGVPKDWYNQIPNALVADATANRFLQALTSDD